MAPARIDSLQVLLNQQRELQANLDKGGLTGATSRQINAIRKAQKEVFEVTDGKSELDKLSMDEKIRLENALERINAEVKGTRRGQEEQEVCWRERITGSSVKSTRCGTKAEQEIAREGARGFLERPRTCAGGCGGVR